MPVEFVKRARRSDTAVSRRRIWRSTCNRYHLIEAVLVLGGERRTTWYAMGPSLADLISRHRTRRAAERAIQRHARRHPS